MHAVWLIFLKKRKPKKVQGIKFNLHALHSSSLLHTLGSYKNYTVKCLAHARNSLPRERVNSQSSSKNSTKLTCPFYRSKPSCSGPQLETSEPSSSATWIVPTIIMLNPGFIPYFYIITCSSLLAHNVHGYELTKPHMHTIMLSSLTGLPPITWKKGVSRKMFHQWLQICHIWRKNFFSLKKITKIIAIDKEKLLLTLKWAKKLALKIFFPLTPFSNKSLLSTLKLVK